jgi:2'-5' RNA ligase
MRAFVGIRVEPRPKILEVLEKLSRLEGVKSVGPENLHINLKFLGQVSDRELEKIKTALLGIRGFGGFTAPLKEVRAFPNNLKIHTIWIGAPSDKLISLAKLIDSELNKLGFGMEREYVPHLTLARVKKKVPEAGSLLGDYDFGTIDINEVELIESELGEQGPKYRTLMKVEL